MQAIVLAGGLGTRLRATVPAQPKAIAPIAGRPFLGLLLDHLATQGCRRVVVSVGHLHQAIVECFGNTYAGMAIEYAREPQPLGTGGAIAFGLTQAHGTVVFVLNGDTFFDLDYRAMLDRFNSTACCLMLALKRVADVARFGAVQVEGGVVRALSEKGRSGPGLINAGVYLMRRDLFQGYAIGECFSFEQDFLSPHVEELAPAAYISDGFFIDIGVPEDYARAQCELSDYLTRERNAQGLK